MTTRIQNRFALSQIASVAMAETRLAGRAIPNLLRNLAPIVAWAVASIALYQRLCWLTHMGIPESLRG
jgi:hypothetical protein